MNRTVCAALLAVLTLALPTLAPPALADGCMIAPWQSEIWEVGQIAYLDWDAETSTERLHILPRLVTHSQDFAWIVPTPSLPELSESDPEAFRQLAYLTMPERRSRDEGWSCGETYDVLAPGAADGGVEIVEAQLVGVYDAMILAADDAGALTDSLTAWGFLHDENADDFTPLLDAYVQEDWYFVTLKVDSTAFAGQLDWGYYAGGLEPIALAFAAEAPIYPMRISALSAADDTSVILYTNAGARLDFEGARTQYANRLSARETAAIRDRYPALGAWLAEGDVLTKLRRDFAPADMDRDLVLVAAASQAEYRPIYYSGWPVTSGLLLAVAGGGWWITRRKRRSRPDWSS